MTVRTKVLLFAAVAVGLTGAMGLALFQLALGGHHFIQQFMALEEQGELRGQLTDEALASMQALLQARRSNQDTRAVLAEQERRSQARLQQMRELVTLAEQERGQVASAEAVARLDQLGAAYVRWLVSTEALVRETSGEPESVLHQGLAEYRRQVESPLKSEWEARRTRLRELMHARLRALKAHQLLGVLLSVLSVSLVVVLAAAILRPLNHSFQELMRGAARIGQGRFEPLVVGDGEFGRLAEALNQMAVQLRTTTCEKERLAKAEAEASTLETRRYNAQLEEAVHKRSAELERSNAQLSASLQRLQAVQTQLLFAERLATIGQVAASVGHEINNPLAFIISNLHFTQGELNRTKGVLTQEESQELQDALSEALDGAERVRLIVLDLKMMSRPDDVERGPVELGAVVHSAAKMAAHEIRHRARLVTQLDGVPPAHGSSARLCQVFLNLLINAAQAIPPGQRNQHEIQVTAYASGPTHLVVEVRDTGCGIPPEQMKRIFDPFFTTKPLGIGNGLGLSVCQSIIEAHGGEIAVESEVGRGTTFRIILPRHKPQ